MTKSILILNARRRVYLIKKMKEYIFSSNIELNIIASDTDLLDPVRFFSDDFVLLPPVNDALFILKLKNYVADKCIIGIMAWYDSDLKDLYAKADAIVELGVKLLLPSKEIFEICNDKRRTHDYFSEKGILTPNCYSFEDFKNNECIPFPLFLKPYDGAGSTHCFKIDNLDMLKTLYDIVPHPFVQQYVEGTMYTVDIFCDYAGRPLCIIPRTRLKVRDSEALISKVQLEDNIISLSMRILSYLNFVGPLNMQFIKNKSGKVYLLEINPRISGGLDLSIAANAPFHIWIIQYFLNKDFEPCPSIVDNLIMTRYYESVFFEESE